jgi:hypothetical protein
MKPMQLKLSMLLALSAWFVLWTGTAQAQDDFPYEVKIQPLVLEGLDGLHSYAFAQWEGHWIFMGGRKDGIHARQPFNAFPQDFSHTDILLVNLSTETIIKRSVADLPDHLALQLQSTNLNFKQKGAHLLLAGGYGFNPLENTHMTYPLLTVVDLPSLVESMIEGNAMASSFVQIEDERFAVAGGQLGVLGDTFLLVGGHRFDGRYNPMGADHGPGFTQTYTHQVRMFRYRLENGELKVEDYEAMTDPIHLRRRDYNLVPQILEGGKEGYMISAGVFQREVDLPFLYPVDITLEGIRPRTEFNQYLSHYHSGKVGLYDLEKGNMHSLFFGGLSQYYYQNGQLYQDVNVPFVSTISRVTRNSEGQLTEYLMEEQMPGLQGASAEFIPWPEREAFSNGVMKLQGGDEDTLLLGHLYGGIKTNERNPFATNRTDRTGADASLYSVLLIRSKSTAHKELLGNHGFDFDLYPNPAREDFNIEFALDSEQEVQIFIANTAGQILQEFKQKGLAGKNIRSVSMERSWKGNVLVVTLILGNEKYATHKILAK